MEHEEQNHEERESARSHQASVEIADALARMFAELKPKIMAKYSLEDEQIILLAIAKTAVKLATNSMQAGSLTPNQTEKLERKLQSIMLNAFMFGELDTADKRAVKTVCSATHWNKRGIFLCGLVAIGSSPRTIAEN